MHIGAYSLNNEIRVRFRVRIRVRVWIVWYIDAQTAARFDGWRGLDRRMPVGQLAHVLADRLSAG